MLILLPPSEGKLCPARGKALDLNALRDSALHDARQQVAAELVSLCQAEPEKARMILGLSEKLGQWVQRNSELCSAATDSASHIYSGVLFGELGLTELSGDELRRANKRIIIFSALFGLARPNDRIPCYRLSGNVKLPELGSLTRFWQEPISLAMQRSAGKQLIVDMRSTPYTSMWSPPKDSGINMVQVKIWQRDGKGNRVAVSHHNKATKGKLARYLATTDNTMNTVPDVLAAIVAQGWQAELDTTANPIRLDVYIES